MCVITYKQRQQCALKKFRKKTWVGRGLKRKRLLSAWVEEVLVFDLGPTERVRIGGKTSKSILYNNLFIRNKNTIKERKINCIEELKFQGDGMTSPHHRADIWLSLDAGTLLFS